MADSQMMGDANYPEQARTYDATRSANREVVRLVLQFLGPGDGRTMLDVAGGTGNYARALGEAGFDPFIVDREPAMLALSTGKIGAGRQIIGDVHALPVRDRSVDAVTCISALHQFDDQRGALAEARRVIRDGPFVLQVFTKENLIPAFAFEYFPGSEPPPSTHQPAASLENMLREVGFKRVAIETFVYSDLADATLHAMHLRPETLLDVELLRNTSFFQRLTPESRQTGLESLRRDLESGRLADRVREGLQLADEHGHGTVVGAWL